MGTEQTRNHPQCGDSKHESCMNSKDTHNNVQLDITHDNSEADELPIVKKSVPALATIPKIPFLDGIRGLACLLVVLHHMAIYSDLNLGGIGVDIFFVLSSLLLTLLFERKAQSMYRKDASYTSWGLALLDYALKRFLRIYPLFACVACTLSLMSSEQKLRLFRVRESEFNLFKTLTFQPKHCHHVLWSLPIEIQYYFCLPIITIVLIKFKWFWYVPAFLALDWIIYQGTHTARDAHDSFYKFFPTFLCGSIAAITYLRIADAILHSKFKFNTYHHYIFRTFQSFNALILVSIIVKGGIFAWLFKYTKPIGIDTRFTSLSVSILIISEMIHPGPISKIFEWSLLRFIGKIGYSVYLIHYFILNTSYVKETKNRYDRFLIMMLLTSILAYMTYQCIEKQSQILASKISMKLKEIDKILSSQVENYHRLVISTEERTE